MSVHTQSKVAAIQFGIMSPDEIRRRSVAHITSIGLYEGENSVVGGLFDPRMGVLDYGKLCPTDGLNSHDCPGYFGHIELALPVFQIQFMKQIIGSLKCICHNCSKLVLKEDSLVAHKYVMRKRGIARFSAMQELCEKVKKCPHCDTLHVAQISHAGSNRRDKDTPSLGSLSVNFKSTQEESLEPEVWSAQRVLAILQKMNDRDCEMIGFDPVQCRPDWLISQVLPVCPPATRPSVNSDNKSRMEDDLTHKYCDIIKTNRALKAKLEKEQAAMNRSESEKNAKVINDWYQLLQYHVATLVNNKISGLPPAQQRSGRPLKSIQERIKYKDGRIRGNLMGKRVDFSARSVITPDPNIGIFELGVPQHVAQRITVPIVVNAINRAKLTDYVRAGYGVYPGAKSIKKKSGRLISLRVLNTQTLTLELGDTVNRYLMDGDFVLFNRQPSLHKMSMQIHRVVVLPYKTFRLNVQVTTPYNADFDGDEMNMHVPQSKQSQVEVVELASVPKQILSPGTNAPVIGIVQDTLIGSYLFTHQTNYLSQKDVEDLASWVPQLSARLPIPDVKAGVKEEELPTDFPRLYWNSSLNYWKGSTIFSSIIPIITMTKATNTSKLTGRSEDKMRIVDGVLKSGVMDKSILGTKENGLVHVIVNDLGSSAAQMFLDDCQSLITNYMLKSGYSVGISDLIADDATLVKMKATIDDKKSQVIKLVNQVHQGVFENNSGQTNYDEFELQVMARLNAALSEAGKTGMSTLGSDNRMLRLVQSGSKGSNINIGQMVACVGQQAVDGKRIPYGFTDRTLPHFHKFDDGPTARGFVENSFLHGLRPEEFFFHAMGGREGLIDTAVKTAETGYIQRKLVKAMEDVRVAQDYTVRDANQRIIQFQYGLDGLDGTFLERQVIPVFTMDLSEMVDMYTLMGKKGKASMNTASKKRMRSEMRETGKMLDRYMAYFVEEKEYCIENLYNRNLEENVFFCANIPRVLSRMNAKVTETQSTMTPMEINAKVAPAIELWSKRFALPRLHILLLKSYLHPMYLLSHYRVTAEYVDDVLDTLVDTMEKKRVAPGELVGTIAAQSIGEPSTQMTLNTFHFAGVSSKSNVTRGVPRFKEILHLSKKIKSPYMQIELLPEYAFDKKKAMEVRNDLSITRLKDVIDTTAIYYDPKSTHSYVTNITTHKDLMELYRDMIELTGASTVDTRSPWVLHMSVNRAKMYASRVTMQDIRYAIDNAMNNNAEIIECLVSDDNADDLVVRIQAKDTQDEEDEQPDEEEEESESKEFACRDMIDNLKTVEKTILENVVIRGIPGINGASMSKEETLVKKDGDYQKMSRWVIDTDGVNLHDVLTHPAVDTTRTFCNQIHTMAEIYGIEAARSIILNEIKEVFEFNDAYVNLRHIMLLVDVMTYRGITMSIDRHGINKTENGPLAKCSFEESTDVIAKTAIFGGMDPMFGVSANIMMGQEVPIGTGAVELIFDEENFRRWKKERSDTLADSSASKTEEGEGEGEGEIPIMCSISSLMEDV